MNVMHRYTNDIFNKKILIIGPYPPPLGGVAVHIKRIEHKLKAQDNIVTIHNTGKKYSFKISSFIALVKKILVTRPDVVIHHEPTESLQKLFTTIIVKYLLRYKIISVDHDCRLLYTFSKIKKKIFRTLIKKVDHCVVIGTITGQCYHDNTIHIPYSMEYPFLPPCLEERESILEKLPSRVHDFIKNHTPLITANAFAPALFCNKDLYGFDLCVGLMQELKTQYPNAGILFGVCNIETDEHKKHFYKIKNDLRELALQDHFCFVTSNNEFWPLIEISDLFVRPTLSDSFGISVQEALYLGVPAIASDVCTRPERTILFKTGDINHFIQQTFFALERRIKMQNTYFIILSGGSGSRLWPISRKDRPKQLVTFLNNTSLLEQTIDRVSTMGPREHIGIITTEEQANLIPEPITQKLGFTLKETSGRNTGPAILYSALDVLKMDSDAILVFLPADHFIPETEKYLLYLKRAIEFASQNDKIVTLGLMPTHAATGYGYIQAEVQGVVKAGNMYNVEKFHEKPDEGKATLYLAQDNMFWNLGMFISRASVLIQEYQRHAPEIYKIVSESLSGENNYDYAPSISIDYAVMEKSKNISIVPCDFEWNDVGNLDIFISTQQKYEKPTHKMISIESENNIAKTSKKIIALIGVSDLCIVEDGEVLVVAKRDKIEKIKKAQTVDFSQ